MGFGLSAKQRYRVLHGRKPQGGPTHSAVYSDAKQV